MKFMHSAVALVALVTLSANASAATIVCSGTVEHLTFHANNSFMLRLSSMNNAVHFCNPEVTWSVAGYSTGPQTCKMLYATFLAARVSGMPLTNVYFDADTVPSTCGTWDPWQSVSIRSYLF